jgi:hypothetical protein
VQLRYVYCVFWPGARPLRLTKNCASARAGYGVRQWARPAGTRVGGRFTALQRHQRCCRFEAFTVVPWKVLRASDGSAKAENARMRSPTHRGGAEACRATMPHPRGVLLAPFWAFCYVITDLRIYPPPSPSHAPTRSRASLNQVCYRRVYANTPYPVPTVRPDRRDRTGRRVTSSGPERIETESRSSRQNLNLLPNLRLMLHAHARHVAVQKPECAVHNCQRAKAWSVHRQQDRATMPMTRAR